MSEQQQVILVDENDRVIGSADKLDAHQKGMLHRAFSVFIFDSAGRLLLQKRAAGKYHSGGLWTNTCCSHAEEGRELLETANRRLLEEMGIDAGIEPFGVFRYKAQCGELVENEIDHLFIGYSDAEPKPDPNEADDWRRCSPDELKAEIGAHPERFTAWFRLIFEKYEDALKKKIEPLRNASAR